jgi:hypothetical protein
MSDFGDVGRSHPAVSHSHILLIQTFIAVMLGCGRVKLSCKSCKSENQRNFNGEICIHFPGLEGLDKPIVWVFPRLAVCLDCGFAEFTVPERELQVLQQEFPVEGAVVLPERVARASKRR